MLPFSTAEVLGFKPKGQFHSGETRALKQTVRDSVGPSGQSDVITFTAPANAGVYSITLAGDGYPQTTITAAALDGDATATEAATALLAAINAEIAASPILTGLITASSNAGVVTITWRRGKTGTVALGLNPSTAMALVTTAASEGATYLYGYIVETVATTTGTLTRTTVRHVASGGTARFGVVVDAKDTAPTTIGGQVYGPEAGASFVVAYPSGADSEIVVACTDTPVDGGAVYVGDGTNGTVQDQAYTASGSGKILVAGMVFAANIDSNTALVRL